MVHIYFTYNYTDGLNRYYYLNCNFCYPPPPPSISGNDDPVNTCSFETFPAVIHGNIDADARIFGNYLPSYKHGVYCERCS